MSAYDDEVRTRGEKEIETSYKQAIAFHNWDMVKTSALAVHGTHKIKDNA